MDLRSVCIPIQESYHLLCYTDSKITSSFLADVSFMSDPISVIFLQKKY